MASILIVYSTVDGQTLKICGRLQQVIAQQGHQAALVAVDGQPDEVLAKFDKVVIGASIRYGKHRPQVYDFIERNRQALESRPSAFFSVNVVARKPEKNRPETNPYIRQFRKITSWRPREVGVFAGKINYPIYGFRDRQIIRLIMWLTKGPTDPHAVVEFTDWDEVEVFGRRICAM
ncbi:MAG TPA: menaquinone-dependent protoporphyrinogen IX dehydrogenase [Noviherbaspirillum sp.]|uniref:menaquinone-dependent protoporphyrinogen IX dehydrogenase n=1 Tax=Noviherbaspirillum sp. TaxID=1926288 RepID=UPI002B482492|nr:menaquinone-dependent protoporphyrinogen IX dehydrogenase [Noviherbaspirillum sp.]HJV86254.1 menaquinone-dependent protoporphyrinogen IX dehydrogenase [Noviherbaspirillum sp.]